MLVEDSVLVGSILFAYLIVVGNVMYLVLCTVVVVVCVPVLLVASDLPMLVHEEIIENWILVGSIASWTLFACCISP